MCIAVMYRYNNQLFRSYFPNMGTVLPICDTQQHHSLMPWGRRIEEVGHLPFGGLVKADSLTKGVWEKYHPEVVKLMLTAYLAYRQGHEYWCDLLAPQWIQGVVLRYQQEKRVYMVMVTNHKGAKKPRVLWGASYPQGTASRYPHLKV